MQASNLSGGEKTVGAVIALLSAYGAYQGADASHQAEVNRSKLDSWRVELDEHRTVRDQMGKLLAADLGTQANVAQAAAQYELAALTLTRLPKKDQTAYATVLVRSMEASLADLAIQRETLEVKHTRGQTVADTVDRLQRIGQASWQIGNVLAELRPKAQVPGQSGFQLAKSNYYRVELFLCEPAKGLTKERILRANTSLQSLKQAYPHNQTVWAVRSASELSPTERLAATGGNHVVADPSEATFAQEVIDKLNDGKHGFGAKSGSAATDRWQVRQQTGNRTTPWYLSLHYCPEH